VDATRDELAAAGCSILVVAQAKPEELSRYLARSAWHVPIVSDPELAGYRTFGLKRTGRLTFFRPGVLWGYFRGMFKGYGLKTPYEGEDLLQLGGDFVLDRRSRIIFAYPSVDPTDRPSIAAIHEAIRGASCASGQ
jgi:peroxiredoxin